MTYAVPRISVTVDHVINAVREPVKFAGFQHISRFAIRADKITGLVEYMDGTVLISYLNRRGQTERTFVEESYASLFTQIKDFAIITE